MRRSAPAFALLSICFSCSCASQPPPSATTKKVVAQKAKRKLSPSELRERELVASIEKARAKKSHPRELSRLESQVMYEIAKLRFDRKDEPGAVAAIERSVRESWFVDEPVLFERARERELAIKREIAKRTADRGNYVDALGMLDQMKMLDRLTAEQQQQIAGDRFVVLDKRGDPAPGESDISDEVALLDRLSSVSVLLEEPPKEMMPVETRTAAVSDTEQAVPLGDPQGGLNVDGARPGLVKGESSPNLPSFDDMPLVETGTIDLKTVSQMLALHRRSIESCYSRALRAGKTPSGKLEVDIAVQPTGDVSDADVRTREFTGTELGRCVTQAIRRWKFPPIEEAKRMTVPFVLGRAF